MVKKKTVERVKKAIELMEKKGLSLTAAAAKAKTDPRTVKKVMRKLKVRKKKTKQGRYVLLQAYWKRYIDKVIYYMMGGWSATAACRASRTTIKTMKKMKVRVNGKSRPLLVGKDGRYYINVNRIVKYGTVVFYGRLVSRYDNVITGTTKRKLEVKDDDLRDDDYANVLWQIDFDPFTTTLLEEGVIAYYPEKVLSVLRGRLVKKLPITSKKAAPYVKGLVSSRPEYAEKMLNVDDSGISAIRSGKNVSASVTMLELIFGQAGVDFDDEVLTGIDERESTDEYLTPSEFKRRKKLVVDKGMFTINIRRRSRAYTYPHKPLLIPFEHDLGKEGKLSRNISGS